MGAGRKTDFNLDYNNKPIAFWQEYGKEYMSDFQFHNPAYIVQEDALVQCLTDINQRHKFYDILEVGCGFGRITKLLLETFKWQIEIFDAIDVSHDQLNNARKYISRVPEEALQGPPNEIVEFHKYDILAWAKHQEQENVDHREQELGDFKYNLVIGVEVLMHVPPSHIKKTVQALCDMTDTYLVTVDWTPTEEQLEQHAKTTGIDPICFAHDYDKIYRDMSSQESNISVITTVPIPQAEQTIFVVRKKV